MDNQIPIVNPTADREHHHKTLAGRALDLHGKTIGLLDNSKPNADEFLKSVGEFLQREYRGVRIVSRRKSNRTEADCLPELLQTCDAVVTAFADWGSCTSWSVHDSTRLESAGIPTATIVTDEFLVLAKAEAETRGISDLPLIKLPHPVGSLSPDALKSLVDSSVGSIVAALCGNRPSGLSNNADAGKSNSGPADDFLPSDPALLFKALMERGWTDGLPVIPPTPAAVGEMIAGSGLPATALLGVIPPLNGKATIEKLAANAVMAGCLPAYFPLVISAFKAMLEPSFNLTGVQTTTSNVTPLIVVNGPCRQALNINYSSNVLGQGWRANSTVGRAIRLILTNIGGAVPGVYDKSTLGQPAKYTFCIAENEEENPWEPLHVERGMKKSQSAVSLCGCTGVHSIVDMASKGPKGILTTMAAAMAAGGSSNWVYGCECLIIMCPEHAASFFTAGYSKADIRRELFEKARLSFDKFSEENLELIEKRRPRWFGPGEGRAIPIVDRDEDIWIVVAGGKGPKSAFIPSWIDVRMSTKEISIDPAPTAITCQC